MKLRELCTIQSGGTPSRSKPEFWENGSIPWVKISDFDGKYVSHTEEKITECGLLSSSAKVFPKGTLLYTIFATLGEVCILDIDAATNQAIAGITIKNDNVDEDYLFYFLTSLKTYVNRIGRGVAQNNINMSILREIEVPLPSIVRQKRIADILGKADQLIEKKERQLITLDELVKSRFVEMFGELEANPHKYMVTSLQTLIDHGMITYHLDGNHGGDYPRSEEFSAKGVPYIGANCIVDGRIDFRIAKHLPIERANRLRKGIAKDGDVLFAHNATVGPVVVLETQEPKVILSTSLTAYRCNTESINPYYLSSYMLSDGFVKQYSAEMKQTTRNQVPITAQKKYLFMVPPIELQEQFAAFVAEVDKSKLAVQQSLEKLETLKKSLMQQYFG